MNGLPYYKAYPRDFFEGTRGMDGDLKGAYRMVLDLIYQHGGRLYNDPGHIAGELGYSVRRWNSLLAVLVEKGKLHVNEGIISNFRADKELLQLAAMQDKQRENASKPRNINTIPKAMADPKPSHTEPEPDTDKKEKKERAPTRSTRKPELPLPDDWVPSDKNVSDAITRGFSQQEIQNEADRFRNHHLANDTRFRNWDAGWLKWLGNARRFANGGVAVTPFPGRGQQGRSLASIAAQRRAAGAY